MEGMKKFRSHHRSLREKTLRPRRAQFCQTAVELGTSGHAAHAPFLNQYVKERELSFLRLFLNTVYMEQAQGEKADKVRITIQQA